MSAHKHTQGPWTVGAGYGPHGVRIDAGSRAICGVIGVTRDAYNPDGSGARPIDTPDGWANARLIAAAPELLEALITKVKDAEQRSFEDWLEFNSPSGDHEAVQRQWLASNDYRGFIGEWREQLDAIAKATGESA